MNELFDSALAALKHGDLALAEELFRRVIQATPSHVAALNLLVVTLMSMERFAEAEPLIAKAISLSPNSDVSFYNFGLICKRLNKPQEAVDQFTKALSLNPAVAETWNNRGAVFNELFQYDRAISDFDRALSINPIYSEAYTNKGKSLVALKRHDEALATYDKALSIKPTLAEGWLGRGWALGGLQRYQEAIAAFDKAFALQPDLIDLEGLRLYARMTVCDWADFEARANHLIDSIRAGKANTDPLLILWLTDMPDDHLRCARAFAEARHPPKTSARTGTIYTHDKMRIGYVSTDFYQHAIATLFMELFELHDRTKVSITAFSFGPDDGSDIRSRIINSFDHFADCRGLSDEAAARSIANHQIDILVDLNGFTTGGRTNIFARRPAPIQVNYLGYPGTMGTPYHDYIIGDQTVFESADAAHYSEKLVKLPFCYQPNDRKRQVSKRQFEREEFGLPKDGFVYCCFNTHYKILPDMFSSWMRILQRADGSVLWLLVDNPTARENLHKECSIRGVDPRRVVFAGKMRQSEHLARHRLADLFLDTLPYNAHTTASDALWTGLPVLTRKGNAFAGRVATSLLKAVGLPELVTHSNDEYEAMAVELAQDRERIRQIRSKLAVNRATAPLFNTPLYARNLEAAYEAMYQRHKAELPPDHIEINI